ncbi:hypothetical protein [Cereibacter sediminicola]|uniref:hypothetical protein n=1 Tax=Cereibacter sediminicola TaxID=2584941 RepID=UPI00119D5A42|nr:hypothetical protein [Cereibacter sediminicola]
MVPARSFLVALGVALVLGAPQVATASSEAARNPQSARGVVQTRSAGTFDWLSRPAVVVRASSEAPATRVRRQIGRGSWICSPAGFGRGSTCYAN